MANSFVWHERLFHVCNPIVHNVFTKNNIQKIKHVSHLVCESCEMAKSHKLCLPIGKHVIAHAMFDLLYMDNWRPFPNPSINGEKYLFSHF